MRRKHGQQSLFGAPCHMPESQLATVGDVGREFLKTKQDLKDENPEKRIDNDKVATNV